MPSRGFVRDDGELGSYNLTLLINLVSTLTGTCVSLLLLVHDILSAILAKH